MCNLDAILSHKYRVNRFIKTLLCFYNNLCCLKNFGVSLWSKQNYNRADITLLNS